MAKKAETGGESFEGMQKRLEEIVSRLESGDVPLEESIQLYEEGTRIHGACSQMLSEARQKIEKLTAADLQRTAKRLLEANALTVVAVGRVNDLKSEF